MQALQSANLQPGARVLVHAGSGGVGHFAVQLAKHHWGAYVVSTSRHAEFLKARVLSFVCAISKSKWYILIPKP